MLSFTCQNSRACSRTNLTVDQIEKLLKAGVLCERGFVLGLLRQQAAESDEHEGRMVLVQAVTTPKQPQELLWPGGLLDELVHLLVLCEGSKHFLLQKL